VPRLERPALPSWFVVCSLKPYENVVPLNRQAADLLNVFAILSASDWRRPCYVMERGPQSGPPDEEIMEATGHVRDALLRIRTEYIEMPDLKLTGRQVQRLWNLPHDISEAALGSLIRDGFLMQAANGAYVLRGLLKGKGEAVGPLRRAS